MSRLTKKTDVLLDKIKGRVKQGVLYSVELRVVKLDPVKSSKPAITIASAIAESSFRRFTDVSNALAVFKDLCNVIDDHRTKYRWPEER